jgi:hypothetical protein
VEVVAEVLAQQVVVQVVSVGAGLFHNLLALSVQEVLQAVRVATLVMDILLLAAVQVEQALVHR